MVIRKHLTTQRQTNIYDIITRTGKPECAVKHVYNEPQRK